jgi:hypothetical protein
LYKLSTIAASLFLLALAPLNAQNIQIVNNLKKEFVPNVAGTAAKLVTRNGTGSQYVSDPAITVSVGMQPYDNDLILVYLYIKNNGVSTMSIDPMQIQCVGTAVSGDSTAITVVDPEKLMRDRLASVSGAALLSQGLANSSVFRPVPPWYQAISQHDQAVLLGDILPGEQLSGIVLLKQPYGPVVSTKRGSTTMNTQTEVYLKDLAVTIPLGGKPYTFNFTVNNDKK